MRTVVFCATVDQARKVATILSEKHSIKAEWVCGDKSMCPDGERKRILQGLADGTVECVCNVGVLTTGWDCPNLEHIVLARPTKSLALFTQIFGRGTRPLPGVVDFEGSTPELRKAAIAKSAKPFFTFTDLRDNAMRHKLVTPVDVLGGEMGLEDDVIKLAKEIADQADEARPLQEMIEEARERKRQMEEADRRRLASLEADINYRLQEVDVFGGAINVDRPVKERGPRMLFGKHKGKLVRDVPLDYLQWAHNNRVFKAEWLALAIAKEIGNRLNRGREGAA